MKTKITWFVIGFLASWLTWATIAFVRAQPRDYTAKCSAELKDIGFNTWLTHAVGWKYGSITMYRSGEKASAAMLAVFSEHTGLPSIYADDRESKGEPDQIMVMDRDFKSMCFSLKDGRFTSFDYSTGIKTSSVSYHDSNCSGEWDMSIGNDFSLCRPSIRVRVDGVLSPYVITNNQGMIRRNGQLLAVVRTNGAWRIATNGLSNVSRD